VLPTGHSFIIADCHLDGSRPAVNELLKEFLSAITGADELWILGDLVEYWLGDDAGNPQLDDVFEALAALHASGTALHLMHGNRDFLLGENFAARIGAKLHRKDELIAVLGNEKLLLMHGDTLCTDDEDYQTLRHTLRSAAWQKNFLGLTIPKRVETARTLRAQSRDATAAKTHDIMDVNEQAVQQVMLKRDITTLIHGHTHRPNTHALTLANKKRQRLVLGDWHNDGAHVVHIQMQPDEVHRTATNDAINSSDRAVITLRKFPFDEPLTEPTEH